MLFAAFGHHLPRWRTYVAAVLLAGLPLWVPVLTPSLPVVVASRVLAGFASGRLNPIVLTVVQERVPPPLRGRFFGVAIDGPGLIPILTAIALLANQTLRAMDVTGTEVVRRREVPFCPSPNTQLTSTTAAPSAA